MQVFSAYLTQNKSESPRQRFLTPTLVMAVLEAFRLTNWSPLIPMAAKRRSNETWQTMWCKYVLTIKPYVVHQRSLNIYVSQGLEVLEKVGEVIGGHVGVVPDGNMLQCWCTPRNFKSIFKDISLLQLLTFSLMPCREWYCWNFLVPELISHLSLGNIFLVRVVGFTFLSPSSLIATNELPWGLISYEVVWGCMTRCSKCLRPALCSYTALVNSCRRLAGSSQNGPGSSK